MVKAVVMPKAGISVESCIIGQWRKKIGDTISEGEILFDYETDKASFECESTAAGTLLEIFFEAGDEVPCLTNVCAIGEAGGDASPLRPGIPTNTAAGTTTSVKKPEVQTVHRAATSSAAVSVSPRARKLAERLKLDPLSADPTGPGGRVIARDIELLKKSGTGTGIGGRTFDKAESAPTGDYSDEKLSKVRKVISASMMRSLSELAQLTHHHSFDAGALLALRKEYKASGAANGMEKVTLNDMVLFAVSRLLKKHPAINAHLLNGEILRQFNGVHLGVAMDTPRGLLVPTVFDACKKSLSEISAEVKRLSEMAQSGSISPNLLQGATFTVSNLGSLGVEMFTPVINPPQTAILGVCGITAKIREGKNGIETYQSMGLSFTYDHRALDGAPASRFVQELCRTLENFSQITNE